MPAKPADHDSPTAVEQRDAPARNPREMVRALSTVFGRDEPAADLEAPWLQRALAQGAPPLLVRGRDGLLYYANRGFSEIANPLVDAEALPPADELADVIVGLGGPYCHEVTVEIEGDRRYYLATHSLAPGPEPASDCVVSCYLPAQGLGRQLRALQLSDDRMRDLVRLVSDVVWECDSDLVLTYASPRILHLLGLHPHEVIGRHWSRLAKNSADLEELLSDLQSRAPFRGLEMRLIDKDGGERLFLVQGLPVFDRASGAHTGFRGTAQDISDHVAHEAALRNAVAAAETANRAKSEFLANMSHELRTPLNAIIGFTEIMAAEGYGPIANERYRGYLGNVLDSGRHLLSLINQILDVAKIEAGKLSLNEDKLDPAGLLGSALRLVAETAERRGIALTKRVPGDRVCLWADESKLKQVLLNLLSNALKFTPAGGQVRCVARLEPDGTFIFQVRDNGIGIEPAHFDAALAPFGQVDSRLNRKFEGTGLGLPLSKALTEAHGGTLELDSAPEVGTTVTVRLPTSRVRPA